MKISRVGIVAKSNSEEAARVAVEIGSFLSKRGVEVVSSPEVPPAKGWRTSPPEGMSADLVIVVGGDGTIMRTAQRVGETPILGVKVGALGFLCETTPDRALETLECVLEGRTFLEFKTRLSVTCGGTCLPDALNEVLITSSRPSKIMRLSVSANGKPIHRGMADGVIVSTTTGSTAYALSAGGPLVDPGLDVLELVFICPLNRGLRPILFPTSTRIEVEVLSDASSGLVVVDGQTSMDIRERSLIAMERSERPAVFLHTSLPSFYEKASRMLNLGLGIH
ncbi:MAG: NAD(+)/NADH kinase [Candidatus Verstraetearchaeota archaeon]|nr:NAD(+)/NADH kinase [Candidatus Verstraetearchaeota archaeon]